MNIRRVLTVLLSMVHARLILRGLLCCLLAIGFSSHASESVTWLIDESDFADYYQSEKHVSIGIDTTNLVLARLADVDFTFKPASVSRINQALQETGNVCTGNRVKTPARKQHGLFSLPMTLHPSALLYYRQGQLKIPARLIDERGRLSSLQELLEEYPDMSFGLARGVSYGSAIDSLIDSLPDDRVSYYQSEKRYQAGPKLLAQGLIDITLLYRTQLDDPRTSAAVKDADLASIGLQQAPRFLKTFITCSRSALGHSIISQVNNILYGLYATPAYVRAHTRHMPATEHAPLKASVKKLRDISVAQGMPLLQIAIDHFPPYSYVDKPGEIRGFDKDYVERLAGKLGVRLDYYACPFARCLKLLENGQADLYISLFRAPEREAYIHYIEPHHSLESSLAFYVRKGSNLIIRSYEDLTGKTVGVLRDSQYFSRFDEDQSIRKVSLVSGDAMLEMLSEGRVDTIIGVKMVMDELITSSGVSDTIDLAPYLYPGSRKVYLGMSKRSRYTYLIPLFSHAIANTPYLSF